MHNYIIKKSQKSVIPLKDILLPFMIEPDEDIEGAVNGERFFLEKGEVSEITYPVFEVLFHAGKIDF